MADYAEARPGAELDRIGRKAPRILLAAEWLPRFTAAVLLKRLICILRPVLDRRLYGRALAAWQFAPDARARRDAAACN